MAFIPPVVAEISASNSTTTLLASMAWFNGTYVDLSRHATVEVMLATDKLGTLYIDFSQDGIVTDKTKTIPFDSTMISAAPAEGIVFSVPVTARWMRVNFQNTDSVIQTKMRLQTKILPGPLGTAQVQDGLSRVDTRPYLYAIAEGEVPKHIAFSKRGVVAGVGSAEICVWGNATAYVWPAAAQQMEVISTGANAADDDGAPAGTGVQQVTISYLDASYVEKSVTLTMNGGTAVPTVVADIFRIQNFRAAAVGSAGAVRGAGGILLRTLGGGTTYGFIPAGMTTARSCFWTVPAGRTLFITHMLPGGVTSAANKFIRVTLRANYNDKDGTILTPLGGFFMPHAESLFAQTPPPLEFPCPLKFPATVDIKVDASSDGTATVICGLRGWYE